jgi:hypothetical protein
MLYEERVNVSRNNPSEHINELCGEHAVYNVSRTGTYKYHLNSKL